MRTHTNNFKNNMKKMGREYNNIVTLIDTEEVLTEELYSVKYYYDGNFLKSVMKSLEIESSIPLENETKINYQLGILVGENFEYMDFGNYYVYSCEKKEDENNYTIVCYDEMLKTMKEYPGINDSFPMTVREYIAAICGSINMTFANSSDTFANYDKIVPSDLYADINYTYRDIFDELAQVTASTICINSDDELEIRYINNTLDTIDEEFLKDTNVTFGEKYGPVNSIVLSRSAESDNVYLRDEDSVAVNGLCEIKIKDNQIMNFNDRSDYLEDILDVLDGLEYYINDFSSTGICYYEICDRYSIQVGENTYSCVLLNDEININQGIEELIYTTKMEESETDYTKADKTDRRINQTYLIVDKQNQTITALAEEVGEYDDRIAEVELTVDSLETLVRDEIDITRSEEGTDPITIYNAMQGDLLELHIYGNNNVFTHLYPRNDLFPSDDLFPIGDSLIHIYTKNFCPDKIDNWINGYIVGATGEEGHSEPYNSSMILSEYIQVDDNEEIYVSFENYDYKIWSIAYYDESKNFISKNVVLNYEYASTTPNNTKYLRFDVVNSNFHYNEQGYENEFPPIGPGEILVIKPMITYSTEKQEYCGHNNSTIDLGVTEVLRRLVKQDGTVVRDSYDMVNNKAVITKRVGIDSGGNMYDLVTPVIIDLGEMIIPVAEGENIFEIVNYNAICKLKWVIRNNFTNTFATTVELQSSITQLANSINLEVKQKVSNNEVIARINMAILGREEAEVPEDIEKSVIEILANKIQITSDYFDLSKTGYITATGGTVGGITLSSNSLYKRYQQSGTNYESGLSLPDTVPSGGTATFFYAGRPIGESYAKSNMFIQHNGNIYFRDGALCCIYEPTITSSGATWVNAMEFNADSLNRYLSNGNRWTIEGIGYQSGVPSMHTLWLYDAKAYSIESGVHGTVLARFARVGNNAEPARIDFYATSYINGYEIQVNTSDERMKENIEESTTDALDILKNIDFYEFDWKKESGNEGHIDIGLVAQRLEKQYDKLVVHSEGTDNRGNPIDTYQINMLNTLTLTMKAVQEINEKVEKQQEEIELLKEEIKKLKGEQND